jgi:dienelactone hydrolase
MKWKNISLALGFSCGLLFFSCNNDEPATDTATEKPAPLVKEDALDYKIDTSEFHSFIAYDQNLEGKRPIVLVIPEWWGLNDYIRSRAKQLAELGYIAMAVDMYGDNKQGNNPDEAGKLATPFYTNPQMAKARMDVALEKIKSYAQSDTSRIAAIGYCFGGSMVLNYAKMGANIDGVVSFHGILEGIPPQKDLLKADILVCHGDNDAFVPPAQVDAFRKKMDSVNANYIFKSYAGGMHAFTNPQADEWGKKFNIPVAYNAAADTASWNDMKDFFKKVLK